MRKIVVMILLVIVAVVGVVGVVEYKALFGATEPNNKEESTFVIPVNFESGEIKNKLQNEGYIKNAQAFAWIVKFKKYGEVLPGGYILRKNMNAFAVAEKLSKNPDMKWLVIKPGMRKEQIGEVLGLDVSGWEHEGQYLPDTYLIPVVENSQQVEQRILANFNEKFAPYLEQFTAKNIIWTTGLKIASLIERETATNEDMASVSGIIWNRLMIGMRLQIDATLQYAKGKVGEKWWSTVYSQDKYIDSPYNTYMHEGLPPMPICEASLEAIDAALNPVETDCLFYLHDHQGVMHCAKTYKEHVANIRKYL
jgi:UPF0755 protein